MDTMPMPGSDTTSTIWVPMCGQSWTNLAASFLAMWTVMMAAMMLPSSIPVLWRYRQSVGRAGGLPPAPLTIFAGAGYFMVWTLLGAAIFPLGAVIFAVTTRYPALARAVPVAVGLIVLAAGALQFTRWKAHHLARCRSGCCHHARGIGRGSPHDWVCAFCHGLRLGLHCSRCCAGLTAVLLVTGIMDVPVMAAVTAGITLERLAPGGERCARIIGIGVIAAGLILSVRAIGLA